MELVHNRFEIIKRLSDTKIFKVFLAKDCKTEKNISIYEVKSEFLDDVSFVNGMTQGIADCRDLKHENTLRFLDLVMDEEDESISYIYEYCDGVSLAEILARQPKLPIAKSIELIIKVLKSLDNAHLLGVCHGDLCPEDILITQDGNVKLRGYGRCDGIEVSSLAKEHLNYETVKYQAPEVISSQGLYESSDVYSAGVILYQMVTGKLPYSGNTSVEIATKIMNEAPLSPRMVNRDLPSSLSALILDSIEKNADRRVKSASSFINSLKETLKNLNSGGYSKPKEKVLIKHEEEKKKVLMPVVLTVCLAVCLLSAIIAHFAISGGRVRVPELVGMSEEEAVSKLQGLKINYIRGEERFSEEVQPGHICDQVPAASEKISKNDSVTYFVSKGAEKIRMPYIIGLDTEAASEKLASGNFNVEILKEYSETLPEGTVIRTVPDADTPLENGTHIMVIVSKGSKNAQNIIPGYGNSSGGSDENMSAFPNESESSLTDREETKDTKTSVREEPRKEKREKRVTEDNTAKPKKQKREETGHRETGPKKEENKPQKENRPESSGYSSSANSDSVVVFE